MPGTALTVRENAPAGKLMGVTGNTGSPESVNSPHGVPSHVKCVCPTLKMSAKLKLGIVVRTSAAVYVGVAKMAVATFQ